MRIIVVANRLPFSVVEEDGNLRMMQSPGGLVSALTTYLSTLGHSFPGMDYLWVGWPGRSIRTEKRTEVSKRALIEFNSYPVYLPERLMDRFYYGFCNRTLWPLFHYFPSLTAFAEDHWNNYREVNQLFCDAVLEVVKPDDLVWIHDYHLMLLPRLLRERLPDSRIGFFLHIPFPTYEIFRLLPASWRQGILEGVLGADVIGFHTYDYAQYFLRCILCILGYEHTMGIIAADGRLIKVDTYPIGIDYRRFNRAAASREIKKKCKQFQKTLGGLKIILSIDRLDYTKGIVKRLEGYQIFLEKNPGEHGRIVLLLVVVPSRVRVEHYQRMKREIDELTGQINGRFGRLHWTPIHYQYRSLQFDELVSLYSLSDIALVTPLRDGMNLIAKEYVAAKTDREGILILSEMAGAAKELSEAIIINPNNPEEIASAIKIALDMPKEEVRERMRTMQMRLKRYDIRRWGNEFMQDLISVEKLSQQVAKRMLESNKSMVLQDFEKAKNRIIFLDYDGTLVQFSPEPKSVAPDKELLDLLEALSLKNEVILISGRGKEVLEDWFRDLDIGLVAEHGAWLKEKGKEWEMIKPLRSDWKSRLIPIFEMCSDRLPGSFVEEKEFSIVLHYRSADPELSSVRAKEFVDYLVNFTASMDLQVEQGSKVIEIRNAGVNKGIAALHWLGKDDFDFVLAVGDDYTDEELFKSVGQDAYSIKVGLGQTAARFSLRSYKEVRDLLGEFRRKDQC